MDLEDTHTNIAKKSNVIEADLQQHTKVMIEVRMFTRKNDHRFSEFVLQKNCSNSVDNLRNSSYIFGTSKRETDSTGHCA